MDGLDDILEQWAAFEAANPAEAERYFAAHPDIKAHVGAAQAKRHSSPGRSDRAGNSTPDADDTDDVLRQRDEFEQSDPESARRYFDDNPSVWSQVQEARRRQGFTSDVPPTSSDDEEGKAAHPPTGRLGGLAGLTGNRGAASAAGALVLLLVLVGTFSLDASQRVTQPSPTTLHEEVVAEVVPPVRPEAPTAATTTAPRVPQRLTSGDIEDVPIPATAVLVEEDGVPDDWAAQQETYDVPMSVDEIHAFFERAMPAAGYSFVGCNVTEGVPQCGYERGDRFVGVEREEGHFALSEIIKSRVDELEGF